MVYWVINRLKWLVNQLSCTAENDSRIQTLESIYFSLVPSSEDVIIVNGVVYCWLIKSLTLAAVPSVYVNVWHLLSLSFKYPQHLKCLWKVSRAAILILCVDVFPFEKGSQGESMWKSLSDFHNSQKRSIPQNLAPNLNKLSNGVAKQLDKRACFQLSKIWQC